MTKKISSYGQVVRVFVAVFGLCSLAGTLCRGVTEGTEVSERRVALIRRLADECLAREGLGAGTFGLAKDILAEFFKAEPSCPSALVLAEPVTEEECKQAARQMARELVAKKYPDLDVAALEAEAAKQFPVYKEGDIVEVEVQLNPARREKVRGPYEGRTATYIVVGRRQMMLADLAAVESNADKLPMFDAQRSNELRQQYVEQKTQAYNDERDKYNESVRLIARREHYRRGAQQNEERGYLFHNGGWSPVRDAVPKIIDEERAKLQAEEERRAAAAAEAVRQEASAVVAAESAVAGLGSPPRWRDPAAEVAEHESRAAAEQQRQASAEDQARQKAEEEAAAAAEAERQKAEQASQAPAPVPAPAEAAAPKQEGGIPWTFIIIAAVVVLAAAGSVVFALSRRRSRDPAKFFEGKGRVQRDFWAAADADPEHFKYVAYLFPTSQAAQDALLQLSFVSQGADGQLKSSRAIELGTYAHQGKFVAFVGGTELHYALWREASAVLPEIAEAEYFRVSEAPEVMLEIPDIEQLLRDADLHIEHVENREGEGKDYSQYYVYRAPDKQNALEFLKRANVTEAGVHVIVQTPEGTWGKDENGIYQE
jgi:hypothetical protein